MTSISAGWVLQATRVYGADPRLRSGSVFALGSGDVPPVHRSQVSRWESGASAVGWSVARRYEEMCRLPPGQVVAAVELAGLASPEHEGTSLRRPRSADVVTETAGYVERALEGEPLSGVEWDRMSWLLSTLPTSFLRHQDWAYLLARGATELSVTTRLAHEQRDVSLTRIASHERARDAVTEVAAEVLRDPGAQVFSEATALLLFAADSRGVGHLLLRAATDPVNTNALRAALVVAAALMKQGRLRGDVARALVRTAYTRCRDDGESYLVRRAAASLLLAVPPAVRAEIRQRLGPGDGALDVTSILANEGTLDLTTGRLVRTRVTAHLATVFGPSVHDDRALTDLLGTVTREANDEDRGRLLQLLMLLPLGHHVGAAYVEELRLAVEARDRRRAHETLSVLLCLTPGEHVEPVVRLATGEAPFPAPVRDELLVEACWALGNAPLPAPELRAITSSVAEAVAGVLTGHRDGTPDTVRAWAYLLGMQGQTRLIGSLTPADGGAAPEVALEWNRARDWWLGLPSYAAPGTCPDRPVVAEDGPGS